MPRELRVYYYYIKIRVESSSALGAIQKVFKAQDELGIMKDISVLGAIPEPAVEDRVRESDFMEEDVFSSQVMRDYTKQTKPCIQANTRTPEEEYKEKEAIAMDAMRCGFREIPLETSIPSFADAPVNIQARDYTPYELPEGITQETILKVHAEADARFRLELMQQKAAEKEVVKIAAKIEKQRTRVIIDEPIPGSVPKTKENINEPRANDTESTEPADNVE